MAEEIKQPAPGTTSAPAGETRQIIQPVQETAPVANEEPKVKVKPLRTFHDSELRRDVNAGGDAFEVTRQHAVRLRANGLVEFESAEAEKEAVGADAAKAHAAAVEAHAQRSAIPDRSKSTPLKNPKLNR